MNYELTHRMPFHESPDYLDNLIHNATEKAISEGRKQKSASSKRPLIYRIAASFAILMTISGLGWTYYETSLTPNSSTLIQNESPLDQFLSQTTDAQAQTINYYEVENISDYE